MTTRAVVPGLATIVGFLVCVEIASGILQGYYTPIFTDIAKNLSIKDASVNWFEAAQLMVSALVVPVLAKLGDLRGHKSVLVLSTAVTALASWWVAFAPNFTTFLIAWALQGFYVVWLPLEISIIHRRTANSGAQQRLTRVAAAVLVMALEIGVIVGALTSGALVAATSLTVVLMLPAIAVTVCLVIIWFGVAETKPEASGRLDWAGFGLVSVALSLVMGGLILVRVLGPSSVIPWLVLLLGLTAFWPFARVELRAREPLVDVPLLCSRGQWPVQVTAFLFGMSVLGAQIPLSTFARTDPEVVGYGLGVSAARVSILIGLYVISMAAGALLMPVVARRIGIRYTLGLAGLLVCVGYGLFLPLHGSLLQTMVNMGIAGLGSGALVAGLPAAAAATAPADRTGFVTGMTNTTKTIGGAIASAVFAIALSSAGSIADPTSGHAPLSGYLTVWAICSASALLASVFLVRWLREPKPTFDPEVSAS